MATKDEEATSLAEVHYQIEDGLSGVYRVFGSASAEQSPSEPIKLLEVNANTVASGIMPIGFGPSPESGLHYPTIIVEVTPDEYSRLQTDDLRLPHGWTIGALIPRPSTYQDR